MDLLPKHLKNESALFEGGRWLTYSELSARVQILAAQLPKQPSLAFCFCQMDSATIVNYLACLLAEHPVVLLDANLNAESKNALIDLYQPGLLLQSADWQTIASAQTALHPSLTLLLSTSGTTGSPKLVRLSAGNILANADSICQALEIQPSDCAMASLPFHYSYGLSVLHSHLRAGASLALSSDGILSAAFWNGCREAQCTSLAGVPYTYQLLKRLGLDKLDVPSLTTLTQAGGKLANNLITEFQETMACRRGRFFVMYGQTEATARMAVMPPWQLAEKLGSVGWPIPQGRFEIQDGELIYHGPNVMLGYATTREDLARGDEHQGRLKTGDLGHFDKDGYLYIDGRLKREVKIAGHRINLDEVEDLLKQHGPTAVVAGSEKILVYCEWGDEVSHSQTLAKLAKRLRFNLQSFEFKRIPALPLSGNGKVDYASLTERP